MDISGTMIWDNSLQAWFTALIITGVIFLVSFFIKRLILRHTNIDETVPVTYSHLIFRLVNRTHFIFLLTVAINVGVLRLSLPETISEGIRTGFLVILFLQSGLWGIAVINYYVASYVQKRAEEDAAGATTIAALGMVAKGVLWVLVALLILENLGIEVTTLVAGLGISGIAVALAVQNILGDLFASFSIVMDQPIVIGDRVNIDEYIGTVEYIGLRDPNPEH